MAPSPRRSKLSLPDGERVCFVCPGGKTAKGTGKAGRYCGRRIRVNCSSNPDTSLKVSARDRNVLRGENRCCCYDWTAYCCYDTPNGSCSLYHCSKTRRATHKLTSFRPYSLSPRPTALARGKSLFQKSPGGSALRSAAANSQTQTPNTSYTKCKSVKVYSPALSSAGLNPTKQFLRGENRRSWNERTAYRRHDTPNGRRTLYHSNKTRRATHDCHQSFLL